MDQLHFFWELLLNTSSSASWWCDGWLSTGILESEGRSLGSSHISFMVIINKKQTFNYAFSHLSNAEIRKMSALTVMFKPVGKRLMREGGATMVSGWLFTKICSEIHNQMIRKDSAQCDCSSKWKEGAGLWWGAGLFPSLFPCKVYWMLWSGFLWLIEQHRNFQTNPVLTAGLEVQIESSGFNV